MSNFHTTVSRRDFMKALGLAGVGFGAAGAAAPVLHDLDEVTASPQATFKRPWWVKERDFGDPTVEVDWDLIEPFDDRNDLWNANTAFARYVGIEEVKRLGNLCTERQKQGIINNTPGLTLRDNALDGGSRVFAANLMPIAGLKSWVGFPKGAYGSPITTPGYYGVPKWQGTPEENTRMLRAAMRFYGASQIGVSELGAKEKKLIYSHHSQGRPFVYEDVDEGYETTEKLVIPNKPLWIVSIAIQMSRENFRQGIGNIKQAANMNRYRIHTIVQGCTQQFLRQLGYHGMGYPDSFYGAMPANADSIMTGLAEMARNNKFCNSPEYGSICGYFSLITDLPLAPTPPIDAGMFRFCHTCRKCAEACPSQAISYESEPSWDIPPVAAYPNIPNLTAVGGKRVFFTDSVNCKIYHYQTPGGCGTCMGTCVFNTNPAASVHEVIKSTVSTTPIFNGFFYNMSKIFDYGITPDEEKEGWWDLSLPVLGQQSTIGAFDGGYSK
ncbi:reductive dehalogenase [Dehalococcoides mccartyi BTF08]|uniref:reductive dehalogenase n=1 Tax=Dehalococcoides mccartyi TaxID=61435 RepID=UPI0002B76083|nr:reductive dehalogenase [Dehalococcoides mccartyi BTF08]